MAKALVIKDVDFSTNKVTTISFDGAHTTAVDVSPSTAELTYVGDTTLLSCTLTPTNSVDPVVWSSSNDSIATVANGLVTAVATGSCTITATSGSYSDTCSITVSISQYLTGIRTVNTLAESNSSSSTNHYSKITCNIGLTQTNYQQYMLMCQGSETVPTDLLCGKMAENVSTTQGSYDFVLIQPNEFTASNEKRTYDNIGYPLPMKLPTGCTKIKCIQLNAKYAAYPIFFKTDTRAINTPQDANGAQYYMAYRYAPTPTSSDYTWVYEAETVFDVPSGYDAVVVSWQSNPNDAEAVKPVNLTAEQIAEFKVMCM